MYVSCVCVTNCLFVKSLTCSRRTFCALGFRPWGLRVRISAGGMSLDDQNFGLFPLMMFQGDHRYFSTLFHPEFDASAYDVDGP